MLYEQAFASENFMPLKSLLEIREQKQILFQMVTQHIVQR